MILWTNSIKGMESFLSFQEMPLHFMEPEVLLLYEADETGPQN